MLVGFLKFQIFYDCEWLHLDEGVNADISTHVLLFCYIYFIN